MKMLRKINNLVDENENWITDCLMLIILKCLAEIIFLMENETIIYWNEKFYDGNMYPCIVTKVF